MRRSEFTHVLHAKVPFPRRLIEPLSLGRLGCSSSPCSRCAAAGARRCWPGTAPPFPQEAHSPVELNVLLLDRLLRALLLWLVRGRRGEG